MDPRPRSVTDLLLVQVRDELRGLRDELSRPAGPDDGTVPIREPMDSATRPPEVAYRDKGSGWYEIVEDGQVVDKVRGEDKAQTRVREVQRLIEEGRY